MFPGRQSQFPDSRTPLIATDKQRYRSTRTFLYHFLPYYCLPRLILIEAFNKNQQEPPRSFWRGWAWGEAPPPHPHGPWRGEGRDVAKATPSSEPSSTSLLPSPHSSSSSSSSSPHGSSSSSPRRALSQPQAPAMAAGGGREAPGAPWGTGRGRERGAPRVPSRRRAATGTRGRGSGVTFPSPGGVQTHPGGSRTHLPEEIPALQTLPGFPGETGNARKGLSQERYLS